MLSYEETESKNGKQRYLVEGICDNCGKLYLRHRTYEKPDTEKETYCVQCQGEVLD